jgi:hypothetical protein
MVMKLEVSLATLALATIVSLPVAAHTTQYSTDLFGSLENPVNMSPGIGVGVVTLDLDTVTMRVEASFNGLLGNVTASHIHCCVDAPANVRVATTVPTFPDFPLGVTFGFYDRTFDMTLAGSYNPDFIVNNGGSIGSALNALVAGLDSGQAYLNIHTNLFPGGEIRGFLQPVPEPGTYAIMLAGLGLVGIMAARRRRLRA